MILYSYLVGLLFPPNVSVKLSSIPIEYLDDTNVVVVGAMVGPGTHACVLQLIVCVDDPTQLAPPPDGAGLVQVRVCVCEPPPQLTLHDPHPHADHPPLTTGVAASHVPVVLFHVLHILVQKLCSLPSICALVVRWFGAVGFAAIIFPIAVMFPLTATLPSTWSFSVGGTPGIVPIPTFPRPAGYDISKKSPSIH